MLREIYCYTTVMRLIIYMVEKALYEKPILNFANSLERN